jgi:hypothetical protein
MALSHNPKTIAKLRLTMPPTPRKTEVKRIWGVLNASVAFEDNDLMDVHPWDRAMDFAVTMLER